MSEARMAVPFVASSPDPEVPEKAQRRKFSAEEKEADSGRRGSRDGARRHRRRAAAGRDLFLDLARLAEGARCRCAQGFFSKTGSAESAESAGRRERKAAAPESALTGELEKAHIVIDVQKKVAKLLGRPLPEIPITEK